MILLWGIASDEPLSAVAAELDRAAVPFLFLNQQLVLDTSIELEIDGSVSGHLRVKDRELRLEDVTAAYLRPWDSQRMRRVLNTPPESPERRHAACIEDAILCWSELTPALVVNRPSRMASNNSKPYQAGLIAQCGFHTPRTLITTDPSAAREFQALHGDVVYKSLSGVRSIVTRLGPQHAARLDDIGNCPVQFQEFVPGVDYRAHVVGSGVYACKIESQDTDYRYPRSEPPRVSSCVLPPEIEARCVRLGAALGLPVAGIDLRRTPAGDWYCFEANPSPGYTFYEAASGAAISKAIAKFLAQCD